MTKGLCVIYAGGTIGMQPSSQGLVPAPLAIETLRAIVGPLPLPLTLVSLAPLLDSANAIPDDWRTLAATILRDSDPYSGFVVIHGTDTLAFAASALSFLLRGLGKPVVFTGAQHPLGTPESDGEDNLRLAVQAAAMPTLTEVMIAFGGRVLRANRAKKLDAQRHVAFDSPNYPRLYQDGAWTPQAAIPVSALLPPPLPDFIAQAVVGWRFTPGHSLTALAGLLVAPTRGLILETYGSGNGPSNDRGLVALLQNAQRRGVVLVAVSQCPWGYVETATYASGNALAQCGVIGAGDMTFEATYAKLHIVLALGMSTGDFLDNWCGEITPAL